MGDVGPALITQAAYARHRGVSRQAVSIAARDGRIPTVGPHKLIDAAVADAAWDANTSPASPDSTAPGNPYRSGNGTPSASSKLHDHRARHEDAKAQLAELDLEQRRGELCRRDDVKRAGDRAARAVTDAVMRVPKALAPQISPVMTPLEAERLMTVALRRALGDALVELRSDLERGDL